MIQTKSMRIVKEHDERKNEIIDTAARLFSAKGYEQCSVNDILAAIGIAKGTFYHYFKSKEEVLDAVTDRASSLIAARVKQVAEDGTLAPEDALLQIFLAMRIEPQMQEGILEEIHKPENALMHQKSLVAVVTVLTPVLTKVVEDGNRAGVFHCEYPRQYMQIFLTSAVTILDNGIFPAEPEQTGELFFALLALLEKILGMEEGSLKEKGRIYLGLQ